MTLYACAPWAVFGCAHPGTRTRLSRAATANARGTAILEACIRLAARFDVVIEDEVDPLGQSGNPSAFHAAWGPARRPRLRAGARRDDLSRAAMSWSRLQDLRMDLCRDNARLACSLPQARQARERHLAQAAQKRLEAHPELLAVSTERASADATYEAVVQSRCAN